MAYRGSAQFYDFFALGKEEEIAFYRLLAQEAGSPALELGVGTGLFAFPLAEDGITVVGLENSREMLQEARKKLQKAPPEIARRLLLLAGDMSDFQLDQQFRIVYIPSGSFQYLITRDQQLGCLRSVKAHLHKEGSFVFDVYTGEFDQSGTWRRLETVSLPEGGAVTRSISTRLRDEEQLIDTVVRFDVHDESGSITDTFFDWSQLAVLTVEDVKFLLAEMHFQVETIYANFARKPWQLGENRAIFVTEPI
ncbi:MAG: class I SAM-dependent methyltransferase [Candidatus Hermodarchaeota archaeon]|nr:class I SAM-dependent methyltransferase [Candidatus Hermodarchaeota archaeon]